MEIRFAVMGYSPLSVWICRNLITEMQFKGCRLKLFWLDDGIEDKAASFKYMNPKISQVADIVCINALPFGNKFFTWLQENAASFHGVFCVYGDDSVNRRTAAAFRNLLPAFQVFTEFIHRLSLIRQHMESALEQKSSYTVKRFFCRKALTGLLWQFMSITASSMACPDVKPERAGRLPLSLKSSPAEIWPFICR